MRVDELRTPPFALVCALGRADVQPELAETLRTRATPPLVLASHPSIEDAPRVLVPRLRKRGVKQNLRTHAHGASASHDAHARGVSSRDDHASADAASTSATSNASLSSHPDIRGALKRDWLLKHRQSKPAVVMALLDNDVLDGSSDARAQLTRSLEKLYGAAHNAGAYVCVVCLAAGPGLPEVLPEDKASIIRKLLNIESRSIVTLNTATAQGREHGWNKAMKVAQELAIKMYGEECDRMTAMVDDPGCPAVLRARYAFKAGTYAEFRQDWVTATKRYRTAYEALPDVRAGMTTQDIIETLEVSEVLHVKLCVLLLHSGSPTEAVHQIEKHMQRWSNAALALAREALPTFHEWRARQYNVFGDLLEHRLPAPAPVGTPRTHLPAFYFHAAAQCSIARRLAFDSVAFDSTSAPVEDVKVELGSYVGQLKIAGTENTRLTPEQYMAYLRVKDTRETISRETIELLTKAHDHYKENSAGTAGGRSFASLIAELANEYLHAGDYKSARKLFTTVAVVYRREKWTELLCSVLLHLKTCAKALRDDEAYLSICLEMAALNEGAASEHAPAAFIAAYAAMNEPRSGAGAGGGEDEDEDEDDVAPTITCGDGHLDRLFIHKAGFSTLDCVPGEPVKFHVALMSNLAGDLDISHIDVDFTESDAYEWSDSRSRVLRSREWLRFSFDIIPKCGYVCEATSLTLTTKSGYEFVIPFTADTSDCSTSSVNYESLPDSVLKMKIKTHTLDVRDAPPRATITMHTPNGSALVGEMSRVDITVTSVADELEEAELLLHVTEDDEPSSNVHILSNTTGDVIPNGNIVIGDVALHATWTGAVCLRWSSDGPPAALHATLTAKRTGARMTEMFKNNPRTAPVESVMHVSCDAPFTVKRAYLPSYRQSPLVLQEDKCSKSPPVGVMLATLHIGGPTELTLDDVKSNVTGAPDKGVTRTDTNNTVILNAGDAFLHVIPLRSQDHGEDSVRVKWHRTHGDSKSDDKAPTVIINEYVLPAVIGSKPPLTVELKFPPKLFLGEPFTYEVRASNATTASYDVKVAVTDSTGFVFSGIKRATMYVPPLSSASFYFLLVPIVTGSAVLPEMSLSAERFAAKFVPPIESRRVYVRPAY